MRILVAALAVLAGCAHPVQFSEASPLWHDADDAPVPMPPKRPWMGNGRMYWGSENAIFRPADRVLTADFGLEAINVNSLDEVPDSAWYVDRRRDPAQPSAPPRALSPEEIARGGATDEAPPKPPFRVVHGLEGGSSLGFVVDDALGRRWALKFDPEGHRGLVTGTDVVTIRLAWASGWLVPPNQLIDVARADIVVAPRATLPNQWGQREPLGEADIDSLLARSPRDRDGRWRAVASRWVAGEVLGPFSWIGKNRHDKNDRWAHENRRDLRGFGVWASWVGDVDVIENNTLDSYIGAPGAGHVVHYQLDVGGSFGSFSDEPMKFWMGDAPYFKLGSILGALLSLGVRPFRWEDERWQERRRRLLDEYPELGGFDGDHFDPRHWHPIVDVPPFSRQTRRDRFWGAKRVAAFSPTEVRAAIAAGQYRPAAADFLFSTLWQRRERIARTWFGDVAPLDHFAVTPAGDGARLCFVDWWVRAGLGGGEATAYRAREGGTVVAETRGSDGEGAACLTLPARAGYRVVALAVERPGQRHFGPDVAVHLSTTARGLRVLGVLR